MPKFVPRQRKHKVIARSKANDKPQFEVVDSNVVEHIPAAKSELEAKKLRLKEDLRQQGQKISGKKAKRLEKYIDTKLRKDENRELIAKLAHATTDTSLFQSSRKLGQGRETKRERLGRALRDKQAGIDIDGDNDELLFEKRVLREEGDELSADESEPEQVTSRGLFETSVAPLPVKLGRRAQATTGRGRRRASGFEEEEAKRWGEIKSRSDARTGTRARMGRFQLRIRSLE
jgi:ATP-dependent RNA helicase DHX37/DHR1